MKKLITALVALTLTITTPAFANPKASLKNANTSLPTLAIIDTAIDDTIPEIKSKLIQQVCILDWPSCPNQTKYQQGSGAAYLNSLIISMNGFDHGTQMASVAIQQNPNMNIVFIRIIGNTGNGGRQTQSVDAIPNALQWVIDNASTYNIKAVSVSQGTMSSVPAGRSDYCPNRPSLETRLGVLAKNDIPVFFAVGNGAPNPNYTRVSWPACSAAPNVIAVGGLTPSGGAPEYFNNYDQSRLDFYDIGFMDVKVPGNTIARKAGSSIATASLAAKWLVVKSAKPTLNYTQIYDLIKTTGTPVSNINFPKFNNLAGIKIELEKAVNG